MLDSVRRLDVAVGLSCSLLALFWLLPKDTQCKVDNVKACGCRLLLILVIRVFDQRSLNCYTVY